MGFASTILPSVNMLYEYYLIHVEQLPEYNKKMINKSVDVPMAVCDYIAGMMDDLGY